MPVHLATTPDQLSRKRSIGMNTPDRNSRPANSRTVLVLDGDVLVRMPVVQFLRDCGYRVVEAATIDEAIALLEKTNIPLDVVLSKIDIPGSMNGFGFAQWARSVRPELKILLAATPERTVRNAAELYEIGPTLKLATTSSYWIASSGCSRLGRSKAAGDRNGGRIGLEDRWLSGLVATLRCFRERHERCATTTTTTATERVVLDRSRRARAGVGPCDMARIALKGCGLPRCCA